MSARSNRERPPTGRNNITTRPFTSGGGNNASNNNSARSGPRSARSLPPPSPKAETRIRSHSARQISGSDGGTGMTLGLDSGRSTGSELSTSEVLRRLREASDHGKNTLAEAEIQALGDYNYYSRPRSSTDFPLRSVLLDPSANNFPRSRTRTELMARIKLSGEPHPSYDLDNDGYVSQEDYRLAKRFDFDGNGVLDPAERKVGKRVLAEEFFKRHAHHLHIFGPNIAQNSHKKNVENLVNSYCFERAYDKLLQLERTVAGEGSKRVMNCMRGGHAEHLLKHNYYTNKFDCTAWNDLDAIPRAATLLGDPGAGHGGSRKRLLFSRREELRSELQNRMTQSTFRQSSGQQGFGGIGASAPNFRRINLITDTKVENS